MRDSTSIFDRPIGESSTSRSAATAAHLASRKRASAVDSSGPENIPWFWQADQASVELRRKIEQAASLKVPILIVGETGSGKDLVARALHEARRKHFGLTKPEAPFVPVNVNTIPENLAESCLFGHERGAFTSARERQSGKFEQAQRGSLLLDEIQSLSLGVQAKLLRVLQDRLFERLGGRSQVETHCQIICASNQPLEVLVEKKTFRLDLYYRLNAFPIYLQPLREKQGLLDDIAQELLEQVQEKYSLKRKSIHPEVVYHLEKYDWPGNYRELEFSLLSAHLKSNTHEITADDLSPQIKGEFQNFIDSGYWGRNVSH